MSTDAEKVEELTGIIQAVRNRIRARYPRHEDDARSPIQIPVADLLPIVHARDAAQAKIAAIGSVNPRAGGAVNGIIQFVKKFIARSLRWFVRDQVVFNREIVSALEAVLEALNDHNTAMLSLASQTAEQMASMRQEVAEMRDARSHWIEWRADWEKKLAANEIQFLRSLADLQGAFQHRTSLIEANFRDIVRTQHAEFQTALERGSTGIQERLWKDLEKVRLDYERLIHNELRIMRQRASVRSAEAEPPVAQPPQVFAPALGFDYGRFAERFRGSEEYVRCNQQFYKRYFAGRMNILDVGCGRGEFLEVMRELGVPARGIDLSEESVARCRQNGLEAERADVFDYLAAAPRGEFDAILSSQVVEHIAPERLPEFIRLCAASLNRDGLLAIETPNPECLAIFATHFYLDPTHTRPVPHPLLAFYMEEAGFGSIEVHQLSPAVESMPEVAQLPEQFRERFFGGLDYAIIGRRL